MLTSWAGDLNGNHVCVELLIAGGTLITSQRMNITLGLLAMQRIVALVSLAQWTDHG